MFAMSITFNPRIWYDKDKWTADQNKSADKIHDDVIKWKHLGNSREFPTQRPVTRSFDVLFDLRPILKRFVVTMLDGARLAASGLNFQFTRALVHCGNKTR